MRAEKNNLQISVQGNSAKSHREDFWPRHYKKSSGLQKEMNKREGEENAIRKVCEKSHIVTKKPAYLEILKSLGLSHGGCRKSTWWKGWKEWFILLSKMQTWLCMLRNFTGATLPMEWLPNSPWMINFLNSCSV